MKTLHDISIMLLEDMKKQLRHGTWTAVFMAAIAWRMLDEGRY